MKYPKRRYITIAVLLFLLPGCLSEEARMERIARHLTDRYEKNTRELSVKYNEALWKVMKGGTKEDYETFVKVGKEQMVSGPGNASREQAALEFYGKKLDLVFEDIESLETVRNILSSGHLKDSMMIREMELLYLHLLNRQANVQGKEELFRQDLRIMQDFPLYKPCYKGDTVNEAELYQILYRSVNSEETGGAWASLMGFGEIAAPEIILSVNIKNKIANELGYRDYYQLAMAFYEQDPDSIQGIFDDFELQTRDLYKTVKQRTDSLIRERYGIKQEDIRPWHYQAKYFTHIPAAFTPPVFYELYEGRDLIAATSRFFGGIGLPVDDIIKRSEFDVENSMLNISFMMNVDYRNDIRVMVGDAGNPHRNFRFMLHEFGHAVHNKYTDQDIPYLLRMPNLAIAEAVSALFERRYYDPALLGEIMGVDGQQLEQFITDCRPSDEMNHLVYMRFIYLLSAFERELFRDPGQDLNALWYELMKKYMLIDCPERYGYPDWAASRHIFLSHTVVHNYLLADIIASQLQFSIENEILQDPLGFDKGIAGREEIGIYLVNNLFCYGNSLFWQDLIRNATGEDLSSDHYMDQYRHVPR